MNKNTAAMAEIKLISDKSGHILYSLSWLDMVREIVGVSGGDRTNEESSAVELFENLDRVGTTCTPPSTVDKMATVGDKTSLVVVYGLLNK